MSASLYVLAEEYRAVAEKLASLDLDEQTIADTLEGLSGALEVKSASIAMMAREYLATADAIKSATADMGKREKAYRKRAERLLEHIRSGMITAEITKIESPFISLSIRDNPPSVVIHSENLIPDEYMRHSEPPAPSPDKQAIARALKEGVDVPGAHLEQGKRLEVK